MYLQIDNPLRLLMVTRDLFFRVSLVVSIFVCIGFNSGHPMLQMSTLWIRIWGLRLARRNASVHRTANFWHGKFVSLMRTDDVLKVWPYTLTQCLIKFSGKPILLVSVTAPGPPKDACALPTEQVAILSSFKFVMSLNPRMTSSIGRESK